MGKNVYTKVKEMLSHVDKKAMTLDELQSLITLHIGSAPITITTALKTMAVTGLIKDIGNSKFEIVKNG